VEQSLSLSYSGLQDQKKLSVPEEEVQVMFIVRWKGRKAEMSNPCSCQCLSKR